MDNLILDEFIIVILCIEGNIVLYITLCNRCKGYCTHCTLIVLILTYSWILLFFAIYINTYVPSSRITFKRNWMNQPGRRSRICKIIRKNKSKGETSTPELAREDQYERKLRFRLNNSKENHNVRREERRWITETSRLPIPKAGT